MKKSMKSLSGLLAMVILALVCYATEVVAAPYQELPPRAGHIPVYIREGNQPLSEIHPGLAEAFHELEELEQKVVDGNSEIVNSVKEGSKDEKKTSGLLNPLKPSETDIASFDAVKGADDKSESSTKSEAEKRDKSKNDDKKEDAQVA